MQPIATWLVARPQNGILALVATLVLPVFSMLGSIVMVVLTLALGFRRAAASAAIAAAVVAAFALLLRVPVGTMLAVTAATLLPPLLLSALVQHWRSLTLTLQVTVVVAMVATLSIHIVLDDPVAFGNEMLTRATTMFNEAGLGQIAEVLEQDRAIIARQMVMILIVTNWVKQAATLVLGYAVFQALPGKKAVFGRFCDLNFGRVLAFIMALASVAAMPSGMAWLQDFAFVSFAIFWIQGLAIVHWLYAEGRLPGLAVGAGYVMLVILPPMIISLAIVGYVDAWFRFRLRKL